MPPAPTKMGAQMPLQQSLFAVHVVLPGRRLHGAAVVVVVVVGGAVVVLVVVATHCPLWQVPEPAPPPLSHDGPVNGVTPQPVTTLQNASLH